MAVSGQTGASIRRKPTLRETDKHARLIVRRLGSDDGLIWASGQRVHLYSKSDWSDCLYQSGFRRRFRVRGAQ